MPVTVTVSQIREALYRADRTAGREPATATTGLLGRWFHEALSYLVSQKPGDGLLGVLAAGPADLESWKSLATARVYEEIVGPRLTRNCALLQESAGQVLVFWQAMREAAEWFAELAWRAHAGLQRGRQGVMQPAWQHLQECFASEVPLECELSDPLWSDTVRLVGIADWVCRPSGVDRWCVVEFKTGRGSSEADLAQVCLYHLILQELSRSGDMAAGYSGALALIRFSPHRTELLLTADQLSVVRVRLLALIGSLAGVSSDPVGEACIVEHRERASGADGAALAMQRVSAVPRGAAVRQNLHSATDCAELGRRIVRTFCEYGVQVSLEDEVVVGPTFLRFTVIPGVGTRVTAIEQRAAELQIRLGFSAEPFISRDQGRLVLDVQRPDRQTIFLTRFAAVWRMRRQDSAVHWCRWGWISQVS